MAGEDNLKGHGFDERTADEQREIARLGGKASGKARREKKRLREQMELLLSMSASEEMIQEMNAIGIEPEEQDIQMALVVAMVGQGLKGDVSAFNSIRDLIGEKPVERLQSDINIISDKSVQEMEDYMKTQWEREKNTET